MKTSKNVKLWICGQLKGKWCPEGSVWEFQGVFSDKDKAVAACRTEKYFISSTILDEELPDKSCIPPEAQYPKILPLTISETGKRLEKINLEGQGVNYVDG